MRRAAAPQIDEFAGAYVNRTPAPGLVDRSRVTLRRRYHTDCEAFLHESASVDDDSSKTLK